MGKCDPPARLVLALLAFAGFIVVYTLRVNLSVALVTMVRSDGADLNSTDQVCPSDATANKSATDGEFDWDEQTQGLLLGSFFWGYILTQIPGGLAGERYGSKWIFGLGVLVPSVLTLLTPAAARLGVGWLIALRVLEGVGEGVTFPSMHAMLGRWIPPMERTMVTVFVFSGTNVGTVLGLPLSGILCSGDFLGGWPAAFYVFGALGCLWFILWCSFVHSFPASHPRISPEEKQLIETSLGVQGDAVSQSPPVPVRSMATSPAVLSLVLNHFSYNWTYYMLLTCLPTYFSRVLAMPINTDGVASALPYLAIALIANAAAVASDVARSRSWLSTTRIRKLCTCIGAVCGIAGLLTVGRLGCDFGWAVGCLTVSVGLYGIVSAGYAPNHLDLSPRFAGTLLGVTNSVATVPGMLAPVIVGAITNGAETRANWRTVFYLSAGVNAAGALCFLAFGSGELQPWANGDGDGDADEERRALINNEAAAENCRA